MEAGNDDGSLPAGRVEGRPAADLSQSGENRRAVGFADVGDVRLIEKLGGERRRLDRDRLRRRLPVRRGRRRPARVRSSMSKSGLPVSRSNRKT